VGGVRGLLRTLAALVADETVSHVGVAFDHVIESFRNELFDGYKTGDGIPEDLWAQFPLAEQAARALGLVVWSMVEFEADDALAAAAARFAGDSRVEQVIICTPDKDLAQCVVGRRVVCLDRRRRLLLDEDGVVAKFGVSPTSIPDWLALVGDDADGIPGVPRFGAKSASALLARYRHVENIPDDETTWNVPLRGADLLGESLRAHRKEAALYKVLATLRTDTPLAESLDDLRWRGPRETDLRECCRDLGDDEFRGPRARV
jgi:5'-3' exonuclease